VGFFSCRLWFGGVVVRKEDCFAVFGVRLPERFFMSSNPVPLSRDIAHADVENPEGLSSFVGRIDALKARVRQGAAASMVDCLDAATLLLRQVLATGCEVSADELLSLASGLVRIVERASDGRGVAAPTKVDAYGADVPLDIYYAGQLRREDDLRARNDMLLGQALVELGYVTVGDVIDALDRQRRSGARFGEVLKEMGVIGDREVVEALNLQARMREAIGTLRPSEPVAEVENPYSTFRRRDADPPAPLPRKRDGLRMANEAPLGEILVMLGFVTPRDLERATQLQRASGRLLGESLVEIGAASWEQINKALSVQAQKKSRLV
jgi:hypothetical protein